MKSKRNLTFTVFILFLTSGTLILPSSGDTQLTSETSTDAAPSIIQTNDGNIWVVWHTYRTGNADIFYKNYDGSSWSNSTQLTTNQAVDILPTILQTSDGTLWVFWTTKRTGNYDIFYKTSSDNGTSWSDATSLTTDLNEDRSSSVTQATNGTMWALWQSNRTGNYDIFYKTSSDLGFSWSDAMPLITNPNHDKYPSILQTSDGTLWVFWATNRTGNYDIFYKTSSDNGAFWSAETQLTTNPSGDFFPSAMQDSAGNIWVVWESDRYVNDDIIYNIYDGQSWSADNSLTWFSPSDRMPSILQATNGTTWLVWSSNKASNFDIYYKSLIVDMAARNVTTSKTIIPQNDTVTIYVIVRNEGTVGVTFNVTAYWNTTSIGTQTKQMIPSFLPQQYTFTWNTLGLPYGYYIVSATVSTALNENDPGDNSLSDLVIITIPGDVNGDRMVNILDAGLVSAHWFPGSPVGPLGYDVNVDINNDGNIDITDAAIVNSNWKKSW